MRDERSRNGNPCVSKTEKADRNIGNYEVHGVKTLWQEEHLQKKNLQLEKQRVACAHD